MTHPELIKTDIPKILMAFYQADILEEEIVTHWGTHASKKVRLTRPRAALTLEQYVAKEISKKVRKAADPFVKWLAEASDDESDDEE